MPNGYDRNLVRLFGAIEGFRARHGRWPQRVLLGQGYIDDFRSILTESGFQQLISKLELVADADANIDAEDDACGRYSYGKEGFSSVDPDLKVSDWLGDLEHKPHESEFS
ncbi:hypothetical protein [Cyanobium sp. Morenito 9A2]|uniref:hypothetical protein n=1 Tax=Cyanobium sp. Morenito 9A2 TaxID=2823718 RepID=UPI0020CEAAF4|nr:hypothetical protein [Cyanobium sp. Morenito 9A2]MCP9850775.1 hypothetical protein [Cyanobium sp. Morenito 9A2]